MTLRRLPRGPVRRVLAYAQHARREARFLNRRRGPALVGGDRNVEPDKVGRWSPQWLAAETGARIRADRAATHGRRTIDWALTRECRVTRIDTHGKHGSDHSLVTLTVRELAGPRSLEVGIWNARHGRDPLVVAREVERIFRVHGLDVLLLSEAQGYIRALGRLPGVRVLSFGDRPGQPKTCLIVRDGVPIGHIGIRRMTWGGWFRAGTRSETAPKWLVHARLGGWLRVGVVHYPPSVRFYERNR
jgi:hypothetical protein